MRTKYTKPAEKHVPVVLTPDYTNMRVIGCESKISLTMKQYKHRTDTTNS